MEKKKVIIDCDPGIDDSLALMLALASPELEVLGITTVCGNVPADLGARNALKVLQFMDRLDIPVYQGAEVPLAREYVNAQDTHGEDGIGDSGLPDVNGVPVRAGAVDYILDTLKKEKGLCLLAIGPMTNVALALQREPEVFKNLGVLISMGGSFKSHGNCSPVAEYNYWCDPDAAAYVYENLGKSKACGLTEGEPPIHMVGLDVTRKVVLTPNILEYMKRLNPEIGGFVEKITRFYFDFHWEQEGIIGCVINDPLAVAYLCRPELCGGFDAYTAVETKGISIGQSVVDAENFWKKAPNSRVLTGVNTEEFMTMLLYRLCGGEESEIRKMMAYSCRGGDGL